MNSTTIFFLFAGNYYHPAGGARDFIGAFPTIEEARKRHANLPKRYEWFNIAQMVDGELVILEEKNFRAPVQLPPPPVTAPNGLIAVINQAVTDAVDAATKREKNASALNARMNEPYYGRFESMPGNW